MFELDGETEAEAQNRDWADPANWGKRTGLTRPAGLSSAARFVPPPPPRPRQPCLALSEAAPGPPTLWRDCSKPPVFLFS